MPTQIPIAQPTLATVISLLERLPIPLMLQTSSGQVLAQNSEWRQQLGELQTSVRLQREIAALLDLPPPLNTFEVTTFENQQCQLGPEPQTCTCACSHKDGQECVWQFTRIYLGVLSRLSESREKNESQLGFLDYRLQPSGSLPSPSAVLLSVASSTESPFHLASLQPTSVSASDAQGLSALTNLDSEDLPAEEKLWIICAQDCTERHRFVQELAARNADLIQLNRLKDEFLACISHELKTPLTAVLGLSSLLKDQLLGSLNERQSRYAQLIYQSGRQLMKVVNDILDLTRIETGQLELTLEPVSIRQVCDRALATVQQLQQTNPGTPNEEATAPSGSLEGKQVEIEIEPDLDFIIADEQRLRQMLVNLLSNAAKFTHPGDSLGLRVNRRHPWIAFTVWDTGIGIPKEKQPLLFQKFQQLEQSLNRQFEGTGLGLALTQRLARLHGGEITFISEEGQGSAFTLLLPAGEIAHSGQTLLPQLPKPIVLVAEAVPHYLEGLYELLSRLSYQVVVARSGLEVIEKTRRLKPAIIFLNPLLPSLSGWDALTLLKSDLTTRQIPVVLTATTAEILQPSPQQIDGFLRLPADLEALQRCLNHLLQQPEPTPPGDTSEVLTLLRFVDFELSDASEEAATVNRLLTTALNQLMCRRRCRVLEADDLEQAELLTRIWKPQAILLETLSSTSSLADLRFIQQSPWLSQVSLITLTTALSLAAEQIPGLTVFPYKFNLEPSFGYSVQAVNALLDLIHQAMLQTKRNRKSAQMNR